jgi:DNA-binding NarL/FixJ family response regulator
VLRILLADDHELVRRGLGELLRLRLGAVIAGEASNGQAAVSIAREIQPDVAVLDVMMPKLDGVEAARAIRASSPCTEVVLVTALDEEALMHDAVAAGVRGMVLKAESVDLIVDAVVAAARHEAFFPEGLRRRPEGAVVERLTPRERQVVQLAAESKSNKEIAEILGISVKTVETHRGNAMRKLGVHSVVDLVHYAIRSGLTTPGRKPGGGGDYV